MKKTFGYYSIIWALFLAIFNVIVFVTPNEAGEISKFGGAFWVGYIFITFAFIGQLAVSYLVFKAENLQKLFYKIPLFRISWTGLVLTLIFGALCMAIPNLPNWIGIIACFIVLGFNAISLIKANTAADIVDEIDSKVKAKSAFIKTITADAEILLNNTQNANLKAEAKKVYEALRYSDPMSKAELVETEEKIEKAFADFKNTVDNEDCALASATADELLSLIDIRNKKCRLLK